MNMAVGERDFDEPCTGATAAVCFAGQVRSFARTGAGLARLVDAFSGASKTFQPESILYLNLQDAGKGGVLKHTVDEIQPSLKIVKAASLGLYSHANDSFVAARARETCWSPSPGHFSHHFTQMWTIASCLKRALDRERACNQTYNVIARARTDLVVPGNALRLIHHIVFNISRSALAPSPIAWLSRGLAADRFFVFTRSVMPRLSRGLLDAFSAARCGVPDAQHYRPDRVACSRAHFALNGTECMLITVLRRAGVEVRLNADLRAELTRNATPDSDMTDSGVAKEPAVAATRRRRLSVRHDSRNISLAILICGQSRTLQAVIDNLDAALMHLRPAADLFMALDLQTFATDSPKTNRTRWNMTFVQHKQLRSQLLRDSLARLLPKNVSVVDRSTGLDTSLLRVRALMVSEERRRRQRYTWVMRLRPDMAFERPFPPFGSGMWPMPRRPTLFADYLSSGANGSKCGPTRHIAPEMLRRHGACVDDNFGFMSRAAADAYFRHWYWDKSCGGTGQLPRLQRHESQLANRSIVSPLASILGLVAGQADRRAEVSPMGSDGRLGCVECRLGCMMWRASVRVAEMPNVAQHRWLVRSVREQTQAHPRAKLLTQSHGALRDTPLLRMEAFEFDQESGERRLWRD